MCFINNTKATRCTCRSQFFYKRLSAVFDEDASFDASEVLGAIEDVFKDDGNPPIDGFEVGLRQNPGQEVAGEGSPQKVAQMFWSTLKVDQFSNGGFAHKTALVERGQ